LQQGDDSFQTPQERCYNIFRALLIGLSPQISLPKAIDDPLGQQLFQNIYLSTFLDSYFTFIIPPFFFKNALN